MTAPSLSAFFRLVEHQRIDSTNEEAKKLAAAGAPAGTLVWALEQLAGKGRRGRRFDSPPGNLYATILLRPDCPPAIGAQVTFVAAIAAAETVAGLLPGDRRVELKWPNDLLVEGRKAAGILLEASADRSRLSWLVVGIGINLRHSPPALRDVATSLAECGAGDVAVETALERLCGRFLHWYGRWRAEGFAPIRARWLALARGLGEAIEVRLDDHALAGRFADLDDSGSLVLELPGGSRRLISAGDVFYPGH
jgi:BirA family biotin operon repressor/biotin-[acetyl-CoA-carboxylase] ligase